jgi:hypothetical protein
LPVLKKKLLPARAGTAVTVATKTRDARLSFARMLLSCPDRSTKLQQTTTLLGKRRSGPTLHQFLAKRRSLKPRLTIK